MGVSTSALRLNVKDIAILFFINHWKCLNKIKSISPHYNDNHDNIDYKFCLCAPISLGRKHLKRIVHRVKYDTRN